jgi:serine/threonine protein phosphatase 1
MPLNFIKRLAGKSRSAPAAPAFDAPLAPDAPLHAIGDIHGRADLLDRLLEKLEADGTERMVFLGDYVDRGEQSRDVLTSLARLCDARPDDVTCLLGNHEQMMLDFLDKPEDGAGRWLRNGGLQTLASFGIGNITEAPTPEQAEVAADALRQSLGAELDAWLRALPRQAASGNVHFVHAAADPALPMSAQDPRHLIWGHPAFFATPRTDGNWIVHGHTVVDQAGAESGRIAVDTGAWFTGRLTAARIAPGALDFVSC